MASKKYLGLEEAASLLKIKTEELIRLREKGEIRGFADRGTWKFKDSDVEEFARRRQPDSDPDVPIMEDDDEFGRQATVIRKGRDTSSDSDVRIVTEKRLTGSSAELPVLDPSKSDSDVKLITDSRLGLKPDSDSDVKLVNPVSQAADSDSDVKLVDPGQRRMSDSDSDVRLAQSDSDVKLYPVSDSDSDVKLMDQGLRGGLSSDSDVALLPADAGGSALFDDDPGISTLPGDSGIQLIGDSGLRLGGDSGLRMANDSGLQLQQPMDSGILLEGDSGLSIGHGDSSITLSDDSGMKLRGSPSSIKPKGGSSKNLRGRKPENLDATAPMLLAQDHDDSDDLSKTSPMMLQHDDDDLRDTLEVPLLDDEESSEASVIMFDDDEDADQASATVVKKGRKPLDDSMFDLDDGAEADEFADDELEVSDEVLGEDDELEDLDAFETDDDEFDEGFEAGASRIGFGSPAGKIAAPQEAEWGTGFFLTLLVSSAVLLVGALMSVDLLRTTWAAENPIYKGELIETVGDMFAK